MWTQVADQVVDDAPWVMMTMTMTMTTMTTTTTTMMMMMAAATTTIEKMMIMTMVMVKIMMTMMVKMKMMMVVMMVTRTPPKNLFIIILFQESSMSLRPTCSSLETFLASFEPKILFNLKKK